MKRPESTANGKTASQLQSPDEQKSTFFPMKSVEIIFLGSLLAVNLIKEKTALRYPKTNLKQIFLPISVIVILVDCVRKVSC